MKSFFENDAVELSPDGKELVILDQTLLPNQEKYITITTAEQLFYAITLLKVRGSHASHRYIGGPGPCDVHEPLRDKRPESVREGVFACEEISCDKPSFSRRPFYRPEPYGKLLLRADEHG